MASNPISPGTRTLDLTEEDATELLQILESRLGETRVEVHHTQTPDYRDKVKREEAIVRGLIEKLRQSRRPAGTSER